MSTPRRYLGTSSVATWFDVRTLTVTKWLTRYPDFPAPDVVVDTERGDVPGWSPARETEIRNWHTNRRGQGWRKQTPQTGKQCQDTQ